MAIRRRFACAEARFLCFGILERTLTNPAAHKEKNPGNYQMLFAVDEAERLALNWLVGAIQRGVLDLGRGLTAASSRTQVLDSSAFFQAKLLASRYASAYISCISMVVPLAGTGPKHPSKLCHWSPRTAGHTS
jgi:hypothetical protein